MTTISNGINHSKVGNVEIIITNESCCKKDKMDPDESDMYAPLWLDKPFVQRILRHDFMSDQLTVDHLDVERAVPKGDNYASLMVRAYAEYRQCQKDKEREKVTLIVKSLPIGEMIAKFVAELGAFKKESRIYEKTLPAMYKLAKERTGEKMEPLATRVYHNDRPDTIVLEDLRPRGYRMASRREGLDLKHSVLALRTLAKFHGLSVALHVEDTTAFDIYTEGMFSEASRKVHEGFAKSTFNSMAEEVATWPGFERFVEKLRKVSEVVMDRVMELIKNKPGSRKVLGHGDFWTNNMMFRYDEEGGVEDVKVLDFQMVNYSSPAIDLIYFLFTSPSQQVLEDHQEEMLEQYHDELCDTMRRMGCDQDLFIPFEELRQELEEKAYFAIMVTSMFCLMVAEPEDTPDMSKVKEEDLKDGKLNVMRKAICGKRFKEAFQRRLPMFESKGFI